MAETSPKRIVHISECADGKRTGTFYASFRRNISTTYSTDVIAQIKAFEVSFSRDFILCCFLRPRPLHWTTLYAHNAGMAGGGDIAAPGYLADLHITALSLVQKYLRHSCTHNLPGQRFATCKRSMGRIRAAKANHRNVQSIVFDCICVDCCASQISPKGWLLAAHQHVWEAFRVRACHRCNVAVGCLRKTHSTLRPKYQGNEASMIHRHCLMSCHDCLRVSNISLLLCTGAYVPVRSQRPFASGGWFRHRDSPSLGEWECNRQVGETKFCYGYLRIVCGGAVFFFPSQNSFANSRFAVSRRCCYCE